MRRRNSYDEYLAAQLTDVESVRLYLQTLTSEIEGSSGLSAEDALRHTIDSMGINEFCKMTGAPQPNVSDFLNGRRNLKPETLNLYLKPFGLKVKLTLESAS